MNFFNSAKKGGQISIHNCAKVASGHGVYIWAYIYTDILPHVD